MYQVLVNNLCDFGNEWAGWRMRGSFLISPQGDRVSARRLAGLLFVEKLHKSKSHRLASILPLRAVASVFDIGEKSNVA